MSNSSLFDLRGRNALVTGSSRGIGRAIALALAEAGANVIIHAAGASKNVEQTLADVRKLGIKSGSIIADLSAPDAAQTIFQEAQAQLGHVDILICNASVQIPEDWQKTDADNFALQVRVNVQSTFELIQRFSPQMAERGWGRIVTIGSVQEARPHPEMTVYAATKCAQSSLVHSLASLLTPQGITVNNIAPGVINTDRNSGRLADEAYQQIVISKIPARRIGSPEDCAGTALLLCSNAGSYITGQSIYVDGGMSL